MSKSLYIAEKPKRGSGVCQCAENKWETKQRVYRSGPGNYNLVRGTFSHDELSRNVMIPNISDGLCPLCRSFQKNLNMK